MQAIYLADVPTYADLIAVYPENGAAIAALPAGTRVYVEDMQCEIRRSTSGNYWVPDRAPGSRVPNGAAAHWFGPAGVFTIATNGAGQARKVFRAMYYRAPGFRPTSIDRISLYQTTAGTVGAGTDAFQLRLYAANPDGSPIENVAALFVWDWNVGGTGGAGTLSLANAGANATRIHGDIAGGAVEVPPHFWLGFAHDLATLAPDLSCAGNTSISHGDGFAALNGSDVANVLNVTRANGYTWTQAGAWTVGDTQVWPSGTDVFAGNIVVPHLRLG
jgi:hypothetical protein